MLRFRFLRLMGLLSLTGLIFLPSFCRADIPLDAEGEWNLYGRFRLRAEQDNDNSQLRENRTRVRIGNYLGVRYSPNESWEMNVRARTGDLRDPRILDSTIYVREDFSYGRRGFVPDEYFLRFKGEENFELTVGRSRMPFWSNSEKLWDEDLTPLGVSARKRVNSGPNPLRLVVGSYTMPDGLEDFHGAMQAAQLDWQQAGQEWNWRWAVALYRWEGDTGARYFRDQRNRDYLIAKLTARLTGKLNDRPAFVGLDLFENTEGYGADDPDIISRRFRDDTLGYAVYFSYGENRKRGDWRFRYVYSHVEWLSAMSSYATTSVGWLTRTNFNAHDVRLGYSLTDQWLAQARVIPSSLIIGDLKSTRLRIDFVRSF